MSYEESVDHFLNNFCTCEEQLTRSKTAESRVCEECRKDQIVDESVLQRVLDEKRKRAEIAENPIYQNIPKVVQEIRNQTERLRSESEIFQEGESEVKEDITVDHFINNFCTISRNIRKITENIREDRDLSLEPEEEPLYDKVGELHLGGTQGDQLYSDPDRNIILTLTPRRRRENFAQVNRGDTYPELNQPDGGYRAAYSH